MGFKSSKLLAAKSFYFVSRKTIIPTSTYELCLREGGAYELKVQDRSHYDHDDNCVCQARAYQRRRTPHCSSCMGESDWGKETFRR